MTAAPSSSRRILLAWELGMGFWHVNALKTLAAPLVEAGHEVTLALSDVVTPWPVYRDTGFRVVPAPRLPPRATHRDHAPLATGYADILWSSGFASPADLGPLVHAWDGLLATTGAEIVIADHAPSLCVAAFRRAPVIQVGLAFTLPPVHLDAFPRLIDAPGLTSEDALLDVVQRVCRARGADVPARLQDVFDTAARLVCTYPELDPYQTTRRAPAIGTLGGVVAPRAATPEPRFFGYIAADYWAIGTLMTGLGESGVPGEVYVRDAPADLKQALRSRGLVVHDQPVPLAEVVERCSVVVHHGGVGVTQQAAAAGAVQLLVPRHLEQACNAAVVEGLGVGAALQGELTVPKVAAALAHLVRSGVKANAAAAWSQTIAERGHGDPAGAVLETMEHL